VVKEEESPYVAYEIPMGRINALAKNMTIIGNVVIFNNSPFSNIHLRVKEKPSS
jgi:hypothetical protein